MIAISAQNLSKGYLKTQSRMKMFRNCFSKNENLERFYALENINFELKKGETLGILGVNGAGKSTLLKMIAGVVAPTSGSLLVNGSLSALLELGAGFNPEFTGIENAKMALAMAGVSKNALEQTLEQVLSFADIGEFAKLPVKVYSSGMFVRLAFSCATVCKPDILLVDEALSVGDLFFQSKCIKRMKDLLDNNGSSLVFVSHDIGAVKSICKKCLLLNGGKQALIGNTSDVAQQYFSIKIDSQKKQPLENNKNSILSNVSQKPKHNLEFKKRADSNRSGNGDAVFLDVQLLDAQTKLPFESFAFNQTVVLRMFFCATKNIDSLCAAYHIQNASGVDVIYSDTIIEKIDIGSIKLNETRIVDWRFNLDLGEGSHNIAAVLSVPLNIESGAVDFCDYVHCALQFQMQRRQDAKIYSLAYWKNEVSINATI